MLHERPVAVSELPDPTRDARERLMAIVTGIDARFVQAGTKLGTAVETIDRVVLALRQVGSVFQEGDAAAAVGNLTRAAERLSDVSSQLDTRTVDIRHIRSASNKLCKHVDEVRKSLEVLQIYGMNVKIAASGAKDFVDFADRMKLQLLAGEVEIGGFDVKLDELEASLAGMEESDRLLDIECARVVPQVPQRLIADAQELFAHQGKLAGLATETGELARSIQGNVGAILGAIQIGDIARQRLEHVLDGCAMMEAQILACDPEEAAATRHHMTLMFVAQLFDTAADFRRETERLIGSLRQIEPQAARLLALQEGNGGSSKKGGGSGGDGGQVFLRRLEAGIAEADAMTAQLRRADRQADETVRIIIDTVDDLSVRAVAVRNLRIDVQQMAINIGLRCRRVEVIGRPVTVIANEIRGYSERLDATIDNITAAAADLNTISLRMRGRDGEDEVKSGDDLGRSLEAIREGAGRTEVAMASAGSEAGEILGMLRQTTDQLEDGLDLGGTIDAIASSLANMAGADVAVSDRADHPVRLLMAEIGRSYTMVREREIHDQFRLPDMASISGSSAAVLDDDDALFDDALF
ncbi:MAG TPA: hypothetical protein VF475_07740 [Sphingobium sp.]